MKQLPTLLLVNTDDQGCGDPGHPMITDADYLGARTIIEGRHKLVIHDQKNGTPRRELFDLNADRAEKNDLAGRQPVLVDKLQTGLRAWQDSVLKSLTGADYAK